ncbi:hypothetical protein L6452_01821 [Arctium lappa]|uniref:Uncharacterized protein n=1 Tax=Arctium lappa TaxID=4217 RepID=A0ACB9FIN5_ARCLA|nr:hypothetical protein L6452_01821 [Arctium lappa]
MVSFARHEYHLNNLPLKPNNHYVVLEPKAFSKDYEPLILLLKKHFLNKALTMTRTDIPETYVQQFWQSCKYEKHEKVGPSIMGFATAPNVNEVLELGINKKVISTIFELPTKTQLNLIKYSDGRYD